MDEDLDVEVEAEKFMQKQAELESGDTSVPELEQAVGVDTVPDEVNFESSLNRGYSFHCSLLGGEEVL